MRILASLVAVAITCCMSAAIAQTYPTKHIRMIVGFAPGGNVDITARILGPLLTTEFGQPVIIDNRPGADGVIGATMVAKSPPDGYTLLTASSMMTTFPAVTNPAKVPFDPVRDYAPISMVHITPYALVATVKSSAPRLSVRELIASAKERPGQITVAYGAIDTRLAIELMHSIAGVRFLPVPYNGGGPALAEVLGGQIETNMTSLPAAISYIRDGTLKGLAVTTLKRSPVMPSLPTMDESGLKGFEAVNFNGVFAPAGTPQAVVNILNAAIIKAIRSAPVREKFQALGSDPQETTPQQFGAYIGSELNKWKKVVETAGIKTD